MEKIKAHLALFLSSLMPYDEKKILSLIEKPKQRKWGLLCLPVFSLGKNSSELAKKLCDKIEKSNSSFIEKAVPAGGFINFHFKDQYILKIFNEIFSSPYSFKKHSLLKTIVVDYSSPNVAKYMNVGHLRATAIGQAVVNIARSYGHKVIAVNHLGDWGTQFGKLILAYKKWGKNQKPTLSLLVNLYVQFHKQAEEDETLNILAKEIFKKMEQGDKECLKLWSAFVKTSMEEYRKIWKKLNIHHDLTQGESFYKDHLEKIEKILNEKKFLTESEGAQVIFLNKMPPCLIKKNDGASTYAFRDLASVFYRFESLKADQNIYITGVDHNLHFKQLKSILEKINKTWSKNTIHLPFGMYRFQGMGKLSSRKGQSISLSDLIHQSAQRVLVKIQEKNPSLKNKIQIAEDVGIGALIFNDLINDRIKDVNFSWDKILDFEGDSGPFVQYCHVRCVSLFKKVVKYEFLKNPSNIEKPELEWIEKLLEFEERREVAFKHFKPHILSIYLLELCRIFSRFYSQNRIIDSSRRNFRLYLTQITKTILKKNLELLNIKAPQEM